MNWIIITDSVGDEPMAIGKGSLPWGNQGPSSWMREAPLRTFWVSHYMAAHGAEFPLEFRLVDGDGRVMYEGRCGDMEAACGDRAFAPQDWAEGNAGCAGTQYRKYGEEKWIDL